LLCPHFPFTLLEPNAFSLRPEQVDEPGLEQGVKLTSSLTLSPHSYIFVETSTEHMLRREYVSGINVNKQRYQAYMKFLLQRIVIRILANIETDLRAD
jgi:hypothetical protein